MVRGAVAEGGGGGAGRSGRTMVSSQNTFGRSIRFDAIRHLETPPPRYDELEGLLRRLTGGGAGRFDPTADGRRRAGGFVRRSGLVTARAGAALVDESSPYDATTLLRHPLIEGRPRVWSAPHPHGVVHRDGADATSTHEVGGGRGGRGASASRGRPIPPTSIFRPSTAAPAPAHWNATSSGRHEASRGLQRAASALPTRARGVADERQPAATHAARRIPKPSPRSPQPPPRLAAAARGTLVGPSRPSTAAPLGRCSTDGGGGGGRTPERATPGGARWRHSYAPLERTSRDLGARRPSTAAPAASRAVVYRSTTTPARGLKRDDETRRPVTAAVGSSGGGRSREPTRGCASRRTDAAVAPPAKEEKSGAKSGGALEVSLAEVSSTDSLPVGAVYLDEDPDASRGVAAALLCPTPPIGDDGLKRPGTAPSAGRRASRGGGTPKPRGGVFVNELDAPNELKRAFGRTGSFAFWESGEGAPSEAVIASDSGENLDAYLPRADRRGGGKDRGDAEEQSEAALALARRAEYIENGRRLDMETHALELTRDISDGSAGEGTEEEEETVDVDADECSEEGNGDDEEEAAMKQARKTGWQYLEEAAGASGEGIDEVEALLRGALRASTLLAKQPPRVKSSVQTERERDAGEVRRMREWLAELEALGSEIGNDERTAVAALGCASGSATPKEEHASAGLAAASAASVEAWAATHAYAMPVAAVDGRAGNPQLTAFDPGHLKEILDFFARLELEVAKAAPAMGSLLPRGLAQLLGFIRRLAGFLSRSVGASSPHLAQLRAALEGLDKAEARAEAWRREAEAAAAARERSAVTAAAEQAALAEKYAATKARAQGVEAELARLRYELEVANERMEMQDRLLNPPLDEFLVGADRGVRQREKEIERSRNMLGLIEQAVTDGMVEVGVQEGQTIGEMLEAMMKEEEQKAREKEKEGKKKKKSEAKAKTKK